MAAPDRVLKYIYFARRRTGLTRDEFKARWRQHGLLSMYLPGWDFIERYEQCDVASARSTCIDGGVELDGVAVIRYLGEFRRSDDPAALEIRARDELELFGARVNTFAVLTEELMAIEPQMTPPFKAFFVLGKRPEPQVSKREACERLVTEIQGCSRTLTSVACNQVTAHPYTTASGIDAQLIVELGWESSAELDDLIGSGRLARGPPWLSAVLGAAQVIHTVPRLLFDRARQYDERKAMRRGMGR